MRGPVKLIDRKNDLKKGYLIRMEIGVIASLLIFIAAVKMDIRAEKSNEGISIDRQEEVFMEEIVQTKQEIKAPPPPRPVVPVAVPNDEIIEDEIIDLDAELDLDAFAMELPPPPPRQIEDEAEEQIFVVVEQMPELIGGMAAVQKQITYPPMAIRAGIEGKVIVQFLIDKEGNVRDPFVIRGIGGGCDEEALKAVSKVKFVPGRQRGKPVVVKFSLPVSFRLETES
ncbi:MAG: energy transducer TonB [Balneola sp.]|jgi:protein TonB|nr:energy transducer TonB [Balneola sp.]MBE79576.1 energy transducer TonB [Balneola sp.]|tara:strand:+ start:721 stop:1401 length:681 start_codon:yes stop_codon:yes gene_type:complete